VKRELEWTKDAYGVSSAKASAADILTKDGDMPQQFDHDDETFWMYTTDEDGNLVYRAGGVGGRRIVFAD
jgi:hypothetical protein